MTPALFLKNGNVWTGDPRRPRAESLLIMDGRILAVGTSKELEAHEAAPNALPLDLKGRSVLPGFTDAHLHLTASARQMSALSLNEASSLTEAMEMVRERAISLKPEEWVYGVRFDNSTWPEKRLPTMADIDALGVPNPVLLLRVCAHIHVANRKAILLGGITASREGVRLDERGEPDGVLHENAANPVVEVMKQSLYGGENDEKAILAACRKMAAEGITSIHPCSADSYGLGENMKAIHALRARGRLPQRVVSYHDSFFDDGRQSGHGDMWIRYGGYKMFLDGSLGGRTAAMTFGYQDEPSNRGTLNHTQEQVNDMLCEAHSRGVQAQVHAIGDAAVDQFITAVEKAIETGPNPCGLPHRIVHLQVCRPDQMEKLKRMGAVCDIQPPFVPSDIRIAGERVGEERISWAYAWRSMMEAGLTVTGSSDNPVEPTNPWRGVWAAVNRVDDNGLPEGGWRPDQKLTLDQALTIYCVNAHKAVGTDSMLGRLSAGMLADLTVLDRNVEETRHEDLLHVKPVLTMLEGRATFGEVERV